MGMTRLVLELFNHEGFPPSSWHGGILDDSEYRKGIWFYMAMDFLWKNSYSKIGTPARPLRTAKNLLNSLPSYHQ
jgi:hypothetical protein